MLLCEPQLPRNAHCSIQGGGRVATALNLYQTREPIEREIEQEREKALKGEKPKSQLECG